MAVIELHHVSKSYFTRSQETRVLKDINLTIEKGSFVSILGRSGSGKTTLLNVISTLLPFESGSLKIAGQEVSQLSKEELNAIRNQTIGFIFQEFNLVQDMSVLDNVATPLVLAGIPMRKARERAIEVLAQVGLEGYAKVRPIELSGGQQQRVAIARALANHQQILLCDEPTGALDDYTARDILSLLKELSKQVTIIMVTHDEEFAKQYSDRLIMLVDGQIAKDEGNQTQVAVPFIQTEIKPLRIGLLNLVQYSILSMDMDRKAFKITFRLFSFALMLYTLFSVILKHIDTFITKYLGTLLVGEVVDRNIILDFIYQFLQQNMVEFFQIVLLILIGFSILSYIFVFAINIMNKKREIAVLKAFGASKRVIAVMFILRPIKFTFVVFKNAFLYTLLGLVLVNGIIDFNSILISDYFLFFRRFFEVLWGVSIQFFYPVSWASVDFPMHFSELISLYALVLGLFMLGSVVPALVISLKDTLRTLASE